MNNLTDQMEAVQRLISKKRYVHTLGVMETAVKLASMYGVDSTKAELAALFHDVARGFQNNELLEMVKKFKIEVTEYDLLVPQLLHGKVGAAFCGEEFKISDHEILDAIRYHTTGRKFMTKLEKVIFVADMVEPNRDYPGVYSLRETAFVDLDRAVLQGLDSTIRHVIGQGMFIHPTGVEARNWILSIVEGNSQNRENI